jgi:hypothetical protein
VTVSPANARNRAAAVAERLEAEAGQWGAMEALAYWKAAADIWLSLTAEPGQFVSVLTSDPVPTAAEVAHEIRRREAPNGART